MRSTMVRQVSDSTTVTIQPGKKGLHSVTQHVDRPTHLGWEFEVEEHDIDFFVECTIGNARRVLFPEGGESMRRYKAGGKIAAHLELKDVGTPAAPATVRLCWSNQTSWTRDRTIRFSVHSWALSAPETAPEGAPQLSAAASWCTPLHSHSPRRQLPLV